MEDSALQWHLNLFDAVLLGTRRIGHAFSLHKHPLLVDMVKEKKILVESCPISNEVLRLCVQDIEELGVMQHIGGALVLQVFEVLWDRAR